MAFKLRYENNGISVNDCYARVETITGSKKWLSVVVSFHSDRESAKFDAKEYLFVPDMNGKNFIQQSYEYLKTLPEFAGAVDC